MPTADSGTTRMGPNKRWRHNYHTKHINDRRVVGFNINSFPKQHNKDGRRTELKKFLKDLAPDIWGLIETNTYWLLLPVEE